MDKWNHYTCEDCGRVTITKHEQDGVTPMFLRCRATKGCRGMAQSAMYMCSQDETQVPHLIWTRPELGELSEALRAYPASVRQGMREHYEMGGCLDKPGPAAV